MISIFKMRDVEERDLILRFTRFHIRIEEFIHIWNGQRIDVSFTRKPPDRRITGPPL